MLVPMTDSTRVDQVRDLFDAWAEAGRAEGMERGHGPTARQAFERLGLKEGQRYLDVGCGNGYTVRWAAQTHPSVQAFGIDVSEKMVARARQLSSEPNARFIHAPFPLSMLRPGSFSAIFSMEVFYYLPDLAAGLSNVASLLEPGGHFVCIVDYYAENTASHSWPTDVGVQMNLLSESAWREAMEAAGLEVIEQARLFSPLADGAEPDWKQEVGSLMTLAHRAS